jgi:hypothetical protein
MSVNQNTSSLQESKDTTIAGDNLLPYYSKNVIAVFSIFFGVLFSSMLLAINFHKKEPRKGVFAIISFGIFYTLIQVVILSILPASIILTYLLSATGGFILSQHYWNKYLGKETQYVKRPIVIPLLIGISLYAIIFYLEYMPYL